jgi:hypothetical protein
MDNEDYDIRKTVKVRAIIEYDVNVPAHFTKDDIEFQRNESSWCNGNLISELKNLEDEDYCLCHFTRFEVIDGI